MPTTGSCEFKLSNEAKNGVVSDPVLLGRGEWAWVDRSVDGKRWLMVNAGCPDCGHPMTLWRRLEGTDAAGHTIDAAGLVKPSVAHSYKVEGVEKCGFHTQPTKLLGFVDLR